MRKPAAPAPSIRTREAIKNQVWRFITLRRWLSPGTADYAAEPTGEMTTQPPKVRTDQSRQALMSWADGRSFLGLNNCAGTESAHRSTLLGKDNESVCFERSVDVTSIGTPERA